MSPEDFDKIYYQAKPPETPTKKRSSINKNLLKYEKYKLSAEGSFYKVFYTENNTIMRVPKKQNRNTTELDILKNIKHPFINKMIKYTIEDNFVTFEMEMADMNLRGCIRTEFFKLENNYKFIRINKNSGNNLIDNIYRGCESRLGSNSIDSFRSTDNIIIKNESDEENELYHSRIELSKSIEIQNWILFMMHNVSTALAYIHGNNIIHMDIKPENILLRIVDGTVVFQICDFNVSMIGEEKIDLDGDKIYMAPEILMNKAFYKSDVFSLGLIYFELINVEIPKTGENYYNLRKNNFEGYKVDRICSEMLDCNHNKRIDSNAVAYYFYQQIT